MTSIAAIARRTAALCCAALLGWSAAGQARAQIEEAPGTAVGVAYGTVRSVERVGSDRPHGAGALVGGLLGAVIGRQFAEGSSARNVGAAVGAAAGAFIGNEIEKSVRRDAAAVRITVALDDGSIRHFDFREGGDLRPGDRVRVEGRMLYRVS